MFTLEKSLSAEDLVSTLDLVSPEVVSNALIASIKPGESNGYNHLSLSLHADTISFLFFIYMFLCSVLQPISPTMQERILWAQTITGLCPCLFNLTLMQSC